MDGNVIIKAVLDTVDVSKNIKALERDLQGISWKNITEGDEKAAKLSSSFKKAGTAATVTLTAPVVAAGKAVFGVASDYEQANARIAAAFGVSGEEAERFSGIGKRIYEGGWGQSLDEVNDALIQCKSTLRDVSDEDLQTVTTNALMLSDTFGADVNESIRGTNALMEGFGLSATEASDLLTAGMQRGLNYTDELGDNLSEYSVRWGEAGMSASEYFSLLEAGTSSGAYNLDKVGDYLNEFLTALSDGRMEESIGSLSEGTQEVFENFKSGSATAEDMLQAVLGDLTQMPNEYDKAALASTLWSSLGEDNAMGMIESLAGVQDSFGDVAGAAQQAQEAASDSFAVKSQEAMRELRGSSEPLGGPRLNIAANVAGVVKSFSEWFAGIGEGGQTAVLAIATIAAAIGPVLSTVGTVVDTVPKIGAAFQVVGKLGTGALGLIAAHPVVAAIAAIIAAVVLLWNNCEEFRDAVTAAWDAVCAAFEVATQVAGDVAQSVGEFFSQLGETLGEALLLIPPEERDKVAVLVDVGYLSTEVMFVQGDALIRHEVLPMGGGHLAADLAMELSITMDMAEELKRKYTFGIGQDQLSVTDPDGQNVSFPRETVLAVIEPRVAELSDMVRDTIEKYASELSQRSTFYITGGGLILMRGGRETISSVVERTFKAPTPPAIKLNSPVYSSAIGLLELVYESVSQMEVKPSESTSKIGSFFKAFFTK